MTQIQLKERFMKAKFIMSSLKKIYQEMKLFKIKICFQIKIIKLALDKFLLNLKNQMIL